MDYSQAHTIDQHSLFFILIGALLLLGLATDFLGRMTRLPRVTLLLGFGFVLGDGATGVLGGITDSWLPYVADLALLFVGFLLGGKVTITQMKANGLVVFCVSISVVLMTLLIVSVGLLMMSLPLTVALLLAAIATATDPVATLDVIHESGARGTFTDTLQGIVAIDDAWGLIVFSMVMAIATMSAGTADPSFILKAAGYELMGAIALGVALGLPMAAVSGRIKPGQPTLVEALGMVLLCGGLAQWLEVSYLLSVMVMGCVVSNLAHHHEQAFHEIEDIEWPVMILFFVLTGSTLDPAMLTTAGYLVLAYIPLRIVARLIGSWPGSMIAGAKPSVRHWMGLALLPQAGVATGMALIASAQLPGARDTIIPVVVIGTVVFELIGPIFERYSLKRAGDLSPLSHPDV